LPVAKFVECIDNLRAVRENDLGEPTSHIVFI